MTLFPKAYEKHLQTDKNMVRTSKKVACDNCRIFCDRNHQYDYRKVRCSICKN